MYLHEQHEPSILLHGLHQAHRRQLAEEQKARGVADMKAPVVLLALWHANDQGQEISQRELARTLRLSPATVAVSLQAMERNGYVSRKIDPADARRNLLSITDKGREAVKLCGDAFQAAGQQMIAGFTPQEREQLVGFFIRMMENLGAPIPGQEPPPFPPPPGMDPCGPDCGPKTGTAHRQRKKERDSQ